MSLHAFLNVCSSLIAGSCSLSRIHMFAHYSEPKPVQTHNSVKHSPPTLPLPVGSSVVWASLPGHCQHSGGWWGSLVWSVRLLEVHNSPLGSAPSGCPLPGVWKKDRYPPEVKWFFRKEQQEGCTVDYPVRVHINCRKLYWFHFWSGHFVVMFMYVKTQLA